MFMAACLAARCFVQTNSPSLVVVVLHSSYPCVCHALQLVINKTIKDPAIAIVVFPALGMISTMTRSRDWEVAIGDAAKDLGMENLALVRHQQTRWDSTYRALQRLDRMQRQVRAAIAALGPNSNMLKFKAHGLKDDNGNTMELNMRAVCDDDWWNNVHAMTTMLEPLKIATTALQVSYHA